MLSNPPLQRTGARSSLAPSAECRDARAAPALLATRGTIDRPAGAAPAADRQVVRPTHAMKTCARCGLVSPDTAGKCDCGFNLVSGDTTGELRRSRRKGWLYTIGGGSLFAFGVLESVGVVPIVSIAVLSLGTHQIDIGALIAGALLAGRGIQILDRSPVGPPKLANPPLQTDGRVARCARSRARR